MGVRLFTLASWEDSQGKIISGEYLADYILPGLIDRVVPLDFNHELGSDGRSYKLTHRSYLESTGPLKHYSAFSERVWPEKDAEVNVTATPMDITFQTDGDGRPILPDPTVKHPVLKPQKHLSNLVRKYMDTHYGLLLKISFC